MKDYYCLNLKFKDKKISDKSFHSHLFVRDESMYIEIIDNDKKSMIDYYFSMSDNSLGLFEENFEIIDSEVSLFFDNSRIYKITSFENRERNQFFTIYISKLCLIKDNVHKEYVNEGAAFLNENGLKVVNLFYSFFANYADKNTYSIDRMNGMHDYYEIKNMNFRPELEFSSNEQRGSKEFTVKKIPTINFRFDGIDYTVIKERLFIVCHFLSFCYGVRVIMEKLRFRTENDIFIFRDTEPNNKTYVSEFLPIFRFLKDNYNIEKILKTQWFENYLKKEKQLTKAIDNYLHAREVNLGATFILLFNIIEIFKSSQKQDKFTFTIKKKELSEKLFDYTKKFLSDGNDESEFEKKLDGIIDKLEFKPFTSPLEDVLRSNNINAEDFGFTFKDLKKTRDSITHGSLNSINEEILQSQVYSLWKITTYLILSNLGLKDDFRKV